MPHTDGVGHRPADQIHVLRADVDDLDIFVRSGDAGGERGIAPQWIEMRRVGIAAGVGQELADALGTDPLELRRKLLAGSPRHLGVLELAARKAGWGKPLPAGRARGIAVHSSFESFGAAVAEVSIEHGRPRVHRYTCAFDCGRVVNPDTIKAQLEGAVGFGLTAALYSEITLKDGRVEQSNFHDYRMLRMHEMPAVDVHIVASDEPSTGVGEPGVPTVAPALCNALFALTKKRIRRLPIRIEDLRA